MDLITSSTSQQAISGQLALWTKLPRAPYYDAITIPNSHPPVIIGGKVLGLPTRTSDVAMFEAQRVWKRASSLSCPRGCATVVKIDSDTILILEGCIFLKSLTEFTIGEPIVVSQDKKVVIDCGQMIDNVAGKGEVANVTWYKDEQLITNDSEVDGVLTKPSKS